MSENCYITVTDDGQLVLMSEELSEIASDKLERWVTYSINAEADELVDYIVRNWASGNRIFTERKGTTREHIGAYALKKRRKTDSITTVVRPGLKITGRQNWIEKWTGTKFEFMRPAFKAFGIEKRLADNVTENLTRMIAKEGLAP